MAILLTGGTGKVSVRLASLLQEAKVPFLLASRGGGGTPAVKFDWLDSSTFKTPFQYKFPGGESISAVSLVLPHSQNPETYVNAFIDYAHKEHNVKRFVLIAGSTAQPGKPAHGQVWQHLLDLGVDYCVLRPTWFMENYLEAGQLNLIKTQGKIISACGDGKVPFISVSDIAAVAFRALTDKQSHNTDYIILGPELLTYDQTAAKLSSCLGREIIHVKLTPEQRYQGLIGYGLPEHIAKFLAFIEGETAKGTEERTNNVVEQVTGRPPKNFDTFAQENKTAWL